MRGTVGNPDPVHSPFQALLSAPCETGGWARWTHGLAHSMAMLVVLLSLNPCCPLAPKDVCKDKSILVPRSSFCFCCSFLRRAPRVGVSCGDIPSRGMGKGCRGG